MSRGTLAIFICHSNNHAGWYKTAVQLISPTQRKSFRKFCGDLSSLLKVQRKLETNRQDIEKVDGVIIGTGKEDYTQKNAYYEFVCQGHTFQLIDVPGIEGNESKFEAEIQKAITKAHLVLYVNPTNKKPEVGTVEKIKKYLKRNAVVYGLCNVRGFAGDYENPENRLQLDKTKGAVEVKSQTKDVLSKILGEERILGVDNIQGLLAFCSVAYTSNQESSIHRNREADLLRSQTRYLSRFSLKENMRDFSRLNVLETVISRKIDTFKDDIVASNKQKTISIIDESLGFLEVLLKENQQITANIKIQIDTSIQLIGRKVRSVADSFALSSDNAVNACYTTLESYACDIIDEHVGDTEKIASMFKSYNTRQANILGEKLAEIRKAELKEFEQHLNKTLGRLNDNVGRICIGAAMRKAEVVNPADLKEIVECLEFSFSDVGSVVDDVITFARLGGLITNNPLGTIAGAIVGLIKSIWDFFKAREGRIREAQTKSRVLIRKARKEHLAELTGIQVQMTNDLRAHAKKIYSSLRGQHSNICQVSTILKGQITTILDLKSNVQRGKYGPV